MDSDSNNNFEATPPDIIQDTDYTIRISCQINQERDEKNVLINLKIAALYSVYIKS